MWYFLMSLSTDNTSASTEFLEVLLARPFALVAQGRSAGASGCGGVFRSVEFGAVVHDGLAAIVGIEDSTRTLDNCGRDLDWVDLVSSSVCSPFENNFPRVGGQ